MGVKGQFNMMQLFIRCGGINNARVGWEVQAGSVANMITRPGLQLANVENTIGSTAALGSDTHTSTGMKYPSAMVDISASTDAYQLMRVGLYVKNPVGNSDLNCVRVRVWLEVEDC